MIDALVKELWVEADVETAFRRFTEGIGDWWPTASHSVSLGQCHAVRFGRGVGQDIAEEADDGSVHVWGTVTRWDPPGAVTFSWHPGREAATAQEIAVTFEDKNGGTLVRLVHSGWERLGPAAEETRHEYDGGWDSVLGGFAQVMMD